MTAIPIRQGPAGIVPPRRAGSIRRTTTVDTTWVGDNRRAPKTVIGRGRDLITDPEGRGRVVAEERLAVIVSPAGDILQVSAEPPRPALAALVGQSTAIGFRRALAGLPTDEATTPLDVLLDDLVGANIVSTNAWVKRSYEDAAAVEADMRAAGVVMEGVCIGFATGGSALASTEPLHTRYDSRKVPPLDSGPDPEAWHPLGRLSDPAARRGRLTDLWVDDQIQLYSYFQDTALVGPGDWRAVHEYSLTATVDPATYVLLAVEVKPHVLPYVECPGAISHTDVVIGMDVRDLRASVPRLLARARGCTHLNDTLRALGDAQDLLAALSWDESDRQLVDSMKGV